MCAIIGSFSPEKIRELYEINSYRGALSYSLATFSSTWIYNVQVNDLVQAKGILPHELPLKEVQGSLIVGHSQAPTTQATNIHPAIIGENMMWHNGIVKQKSLDKDMWDTSWLLEQIIDYGWSSLSRVDGTFACVLYKDGKLYIFRNEISPLYYDRELNISSTKFEGAIDLPPNRVYELDIVNKRLLEVAQFQTFENPYYIPE